MTSRVSVEEVMTELLQGTADATSTKDRRSNDVPKYFKALDVDPFNLSSRLQSQYSSVSPSPVHPVPSNCEADTRQLANKVLTRCGATELEIGEELLWHGTNPDNVEPIRSQGFKEAKCERSYVGKAVYFAERTTGMKPSRATNRTMHARLRHASARIAMLRNSDGSRCHAAGGKITAGRSSPVSGVVRKRIVDVGTRPGSCAAGKASEQAEGSSCQLKDPTAMTSRVSVEEVMTELLQSTADATSTKDRRSNDVPKYFKALKVDRFMLSSHLQSQYSSVSPSPVHPVPSNCEADTRQLANKVLTRCGATELEIGEELLWHGTNPDNVEPIGLQGFKEAKCERSYVGKAVYFAESITKADEYVPQNRRRQVLLVKVRVGRPAVCSDKDPSSKERELRKQAQESTGCVLLDRKAAVGTFREWAMLDGRQCLPCLLVTYETSSTPFQLDWEKATLRRALEDDTERETRQAIHMSLAIQMGMAVPMGGYGRVGHSLSIGPGPSMGPPVSRLGVFLANLETTGGGGLGRGLGGDMEVCFPGMGRGMGGGLGGGLGGDMEVCFPGMG
eukprot:CAMPEP_0204393508 /NCGR_PEP_ID=MMETSP0469-20131031/62355_1 /ASSEMBLY_ACC=CAM_ASM_000384 /TAXON_ID=2969 /ORGANISM="Oxyrrhis marina" /LENGTH=561 /DNA_ID=CAMNT_0051387581 /DNA_START=74 /DNA_END=1756 /DNA_ORIENTATION=-